MINSNAYSRNPFFCGHTTLPGLEERHTPAQEAILFVTHFQKIVDPYSRDSVQNERITTTLHMIRDWIYADYVLGRGWSRKKLLYTIDFLLDTNTLVSRASLDTVGAKFDRGELPIQQLAQTPKRKGRI